MSISPFNLLIKAIENGFANKYNIKEIMNQANLFLFNDDDKIYSEKFEIAKVLEDDGLRLPFPITAIECKKWASVIMEADTFYEISGCKSENSSPTFIQITTVVTNDGSGGDSYVSGISFDEGRKNIGTSPLEIMVYFDNKYLTMMSESKFINESARETFKMDAEKGFINTNTVAVLAVTKINNIEKFVIEVTPKSLPRKASSKSGIRKKHERITYLVEGATEFRSRGDLKPVKSGGKRGPYWKRGHWRHFEKDYFVNKKGTKTWIKPVWCGETTYEKGGKIYRVILDK